MIPKRIVRHLHHNHFWISDGVLYESYNTIRGLRYCAIMNVSLADNDDVSDEIIKQIKEKYLMYQ